MSGCSVPDDCVVEMCRFGAAELHTIGAILGGMAAQVWVGRGTGGGGVSRAAELHTVTALQQERSGRERDCRLCPVRLALSCNNTGYRAIGSMTEEAIELTPSLQHGSPFPPLSPPPPPHAGGHQDHHARPLPPRTQEAIKLITRQFVPVPGTLIYNGITATTSALEL